MKLNNSWRKNIRNKKIIFVGYTFLVSISIICIFTFFSKINKEVQILNRINKNMVKIRSFSEVIFIHAIVKNNEELKMEFDYIKKEIEELSLMTGEKNFEFIHRISKTTQNLEEKINKIIKIIEQTGLATNTGLRRKLNTNQKIIQNIVKDLELSDLEDVINEYFKKQETFINTFDDRYLQNCNSNFVLILKKLNSYKLSVEQEKNIIKYLNAYSNTCSKIRKNIKIIGTSPHTGLRGELSMSMKKLETGILQHNDRIYEKQKKLYKYFIIEIILLFWVLITSIVLYFKLLKSNLRLEFVRIDKKETSRRLIKVKNNHKRADYLSVKLLKNIYSFIKIHDTTINKYVGQLIEISKLESKTYKVYNRNFDTLEFIINLKKYNKRINIIKNENLETSINVSTDFKILKKIFLNIIHFLDKNTQDKNDINLGIQKINTEKIIFFVFVNQSIEIEEEDMLTKFKYINLEKDLSGVEIINSKKMINLIGGNLAFNYYEQDNKSIFTFDILRNMKSERTSKQIKNKYDWSDRTIIVGEPDDQYFELIEKEIQKTDARLIRAKNGLKVLEEYKNVEGNVDLVIFDINMSKLNGYALTKELKKLNLNLEIIAYTAYSIAGERSQILAAGCSEYLKKPMKINKLMNYIDKYLEFNYKFVN